MAKPKAVPEGLSTIEKLTAVYSEKRDVALEIAVALNDEIKAAKAKRLPALRKAVLAEKDAHAALKQAIETERLQFAKPRTRLFHGIRVGFRKLVGSLSWLDSEQVVKLIEKHFPEQAGVLIRTVKTPVKDSLALLKGEELKKLGVTVDADSDEVVIKPEHGEIDKLIVALLKEPETEKAS